jgi:hypothetical protein
METIELAPDFKEFLSLLNSHGVEHLLVGGYAVAYHGYPRTTNDMDIWAGVSPENAEKLVTALREFGFSHSSVDAAAFLDEKRIIRMGVPPVCIDLIMSISGLNFATCFTKRVVGEIDGITVNLLSLEDLKTNNRASGRHKDLDDLEHLL